MAIVNHFPFSTNWPPEVDESALPAQIKNTGLSSRACTVLQYNKVISDVIIHNDDPHREEYIIYPLAPFYIRIDATDLSTAQKTFELEPSHEYTLMRHLSRMGSASRYYTRTLFNKDGERILDYQGFTTDVLFYWSITPFS